ncbi:ICMT-domain-containing protein [Marasmius fiardii PR-910]|nr:ICMT-domain-containing protein [Marasmius fiardii PR-910]
MSLFKIPLLLLNAGGLLASQAFSSPPPPVIEVRYSRRKSERFLHTALPGITLFTPAIFLLETVIIILSQLRGPPRRLASLLMLFGNPESIHTSATFVLGTMIICMSAILRYACHQHMGRLFTHELAIRKNHKLVVDGPYSFVRHPGYTSWLITELGLLIAFSARGSWITESGVLDIGIGRAVAGLYLLVFATADTVLLLKRVPKEEGLLKKEFGKEWNDYKRRVPWKLIPGVY